MGLQFVRTEFLRESGIRFIEGIIHEDEPFSCLLTIKAERVLCIDKAYHRRRLRGNSIITGTDEIEKIRSLNIGCLAIVAHLIEDKSIGQSAKKVALVRAEEISNRVDQEMRQLSRKARRAVFIGLPEEYRAIGSMFPQGKKLAEAESPKSFSGKLFKKSRSLLIRIKNEGVTETARYALRYAKRLWARIKAKLTI